MSTEKESKPQATIKDLPEPAKATRDAEQVKGGRMATESGDVTQNGQVGGDTG